MTHNEAFLKIEVLKAKMMILQTDIIKKLYRHYLVYGEMDPSVADDESNEMKEILHQIEDIEHQVD